MSRDGWLRIEDTGPGIPAQALPHVYERFYRAGEAAAPSCGVGIGLACCCAVRRASIRLRTSIDESNIFCRIASMVL
ncbi:ATP-binding protein [Paraburkholderia hospita]|nr:ATP-binding protein [Paraburkholderia hospita]